MKLLLALATVHQGISQEVTNPIDPQALRGDYLGQEPPGKRPELFAPGIISTDSVELNSVFSSDGRRFFFTRRVNGAFKIFISENLDGFWTESRIISFSKTHPRYDEVDMMLTPGQDTLMFISNVPSTEFKAKSVNIWWSTWEGKRWLTPTILPAPINSDFQEVYPILTNKSNLFFSSSRDGGFGGKDLYYSRYESGQFSASVNIGPPINSEYVEGDAYVSPDEDYIIISSSGRPGSQKTDLYISFQNEEGGYSDPINMGPEVNSDGNEYCPIVSPDRKYLFFTRDGDIYWADASILEGYRH